MAYFNNLKGAYLSLPQIDKTLSADAAATGIVRGSCIYEDAGVWKLCTTGGKADPKQYVFFALQSFGDLTAGMAGSSGQGNAGGVPRITGFAVGNPAEIQIDQYVDAVYTIGQLLTIGATGKVGAHTSGDNCVGQVTAAAANKWVNDAIAVTGFKTGAFLAVLTFRTLWIPRLLTA